MEEKAAITANKDLFINLMTNELKRVHRLRIKAYQKGRRSKARIQSEKIATKIGTISVGLGAIDMIAASLILASISSEESEQITVTKITEGYLKN